MISEQSIPVIGASPSILYTDVHKETYEESKQVIRSKVDGKVLGVGENYINIDGEPIKVERELPTSNHTTVTYSHQVKPGDRVTEGTILSQSNSFVNNEFCTNVPMLTAYTGYYALEHEDAVVLSKSAALKFGHPDTYTVTIPIKYHDVKVNQITPTDILDEFSLIKNNALVKPGDPLFAYTSVIDVLGKYTYRPEVTRVPYSIEGGVAKVRFKIYKTKRTKANDNDKYLRYNGLEDLYKHFLKRAADDLMEEANATHLPPAKIKKDFEFIKEEPSLANSIFMEVIITIDYINTAKLHDKITNQYGGKGTVSIVVPDEEMLRTEDGRVIDMIMSPLALLSRANISQLYESLLSLICVEFYKELDKYFTGKDSLSESTLQEVADKLYWYNKSNNLRSIYEESKKFGYCRVRVSSFDKYFTLDVLNDLKSLLKIKDEVRIYDPKSKRYIRTPVRIGYQNFYRLHFIPENKMTVRGGDKGLVLKDRQPLLEGYGRIKSDGQKIGKQIAA